MHRNDRRASPGPAASARTRLRAAQQVQRPEPAAVAVARLDGTGIAVPVFRRNCENQVGDCSGCTTGKDGDGAGSRTPMSGRDWKRWWNAIQEPIRAAHK